ncbi:MAG: inositol-3-phosphate synthase, partial [Ilumatobacteraceae bacterium]
MQRRVGAALVGMGGAVASTVVAGIELLRLGLIGDEGLPLADADEDQLVAYTQLCFGGWDVDASDLAKAADVHRVLDDAHLRAVGSTLARYRPWPAVGSPSFCRNIDGSNVTASTSLRSCADAVISDLEAFRVDQHLDEVIVVNLASTERWADPASPALNDVREFERALDDDDSETISPAMLYAYGAITSGFPYVNFTPSQGGDVPALVELATRAGVPIAGKDGKTGQTMLKTVLAPGLRSRALRVDGWYSANLLGNRDGQALEDAASLASKRATKSSVLDDVLGYAVPDHLVDIRYYRPRGDEKEAWDSIDVVGFMGRRMQVKVNFLCRDSVLAAPLVIELIRLMDLAHRRGESGVQEQFGTFFKA